MHRALALVCSLAACHGAPPPRTPGAAPAPLTRDTSIDLDGDPNGLLWDDASRTLYIADEAHDRILSWADARGLNVFAELPPIDGHPGLGQLARAADGTLYVTRFGFGAAGGVAYARSDGSVGVLAGLDLARRRVGLAIAPDGVLYDAWFVKHGDAPGGGVARLGADGREQPIMSGLKKPVGLLIRGDALYVSDQQAGRIFRASLSSPTPTSAPVVFAAGVPGVDLVCAGPGGDLFAGGGSVVYRVDAGGHASELASGLSRVRGVAYDASARRLFVAEHGGLTPGDPHHRVLILRVP